MNRIVVDSHTGVKRVKQYLLSWSGGRLPEGVLIDHHRERQPILEYFRVNAAIREALKPRVDLPSGGYIIIEPTEALTVVDVNSGSFTRSATARETVLWTNCEAATEIARQLRLRHLAGVIIVDFIDMDSPKDKLQVLEHFNKQLRADKARPQIAQLSELGLVELTRKRMGQNIYELFGQNCPTCGGLGHLVHLPGEATRNGEIGESSVPVPLVPVPAKEARVLPYGNELNLRETPLTEMWEEGSETLDISALDDDGAGDLISHPSYQDRAGAAKNRRRRRRIGEPPLREESDFSNRIPVRPTPINNFKPDLIAEPTDIVDDEPFPLPSTQVERVEKPQRPRPSRQEIEPPEIISIEMTPEEQEVYAWAGISPLVRLNQQVKNPKSVIIKLLLPGQSAVIEMPKDLLVESSFEPIERVVESQSPEYSERLVESNAIETPDDLEASPQILMTDEADNNPAINRRRRRRSSAVGAEASVASEN
ncbi:MAG: hypothetical protein NVS2B14_05450 [Chamaesiphon sp.]